jgi:[glutamine synthetase] adenylyltransferase / [glutamine synthetase]-adenylyl-L-tyrosine phosphorylase
MSRLVDMIRTAPFGADPDDSASRLRDIVAELPEQGATWLRRALRKGGTPRDLLAGIASGSPFLWGLCIADLSRLDRLLGADPAEGLEAALARAREGCDAAEAPADAMRALRALKQEAALLSALCDIGGVWPLAEVTRALSRTADTALSSALRWLIRDAARAGRIELEDAADPERGTGLFALGMGKHGACELNYSSDIDIIVFYEPGRARLRDGIEPGAFFVRLTQQIVRFLSERTEDGYVFRVDLRLRPDPSATAIAVSVPAAYGYYESVGQNWERAAMIKARVCAGDRSVGEEFLAGLSPFIWRRHLDYAAIADVHAMKRQIHVHKGHEEVAVAGHDLKLGRGGIREIEFFVQTQQLIAGGRNPALRGRDTVGMLDALFQAGWITKSACDELTEAYAFLRGLEHRLQMIADEQTHALPRNAEALFRFARFAGYADTAAFSEALVARLHTVQRHYAKLFETSPALSTSAGSLVFTGKSDDPATLDTLARLGFHSPAAVAEMIRGWHFGRYPAMRSARAREDLTELTPALLEALGRAGPPDQALLAFDGLLSRMPSGYQLFSILRNNARLLDVLARILGLAPRLGELLAGRPHALDGLLEPNPGGADEAALEARLRATLAIGEGYEDRLDRARITVRERLFVIGARMLSGELEPGDASLEISALAVAALRVVLDLVTDELTRVHGRPPGGRVAIVAMGKLGGREMTATSDLDLLAIYDHDPEATETVGGRPVAPSVWFARLTQRLIAALSAPTAQGTLYAVDMRLRPSGRKGPVAVHVGGFADYQRKEAWTWEHMALTRARVVAGDPQLGREIEAIVRDVLTMPRKDAKVKRDIVEMRRLLAQEKGEADLWDLKQVAGGMVDIEFLVQGLQLMNAHAHPDILETNTVAALDRIAGAGLIDGASHRSLSEAIDMDVRLTQLLRLCIGTEAGAARAPEALRAFLATQCDVASFSMLEATLRERQQSVRALFRSVMS